MQEVFKSRPTWDKRDSVKCWKYAATNVISDMTKPSSAFKTIRIHVEVAFIWVFFLLHLCRQLFTGFHYSNIAIDKIVYSTVYIVVRLHLLRSAAVYFSHCPHTKGTLINWANPHALVRMWATVDSHQIRLITFFAKVDWEIFYQFWSNIG